MGGHAKKPASPNQQASSGPTFNPAPKPKPRQQSPEKTEDVTQRELSTDDDYQTELPQGSTSLAAARAGDEAVNEAEGDASPFRLPAMQFSSEHSKQMEEELKAKANTYNRDRLGHGSGNAPYKEMMGQADGY